MPNLTHESEIQEPSLGRPEPPQLNRKFLAAEIAARLIGSAEVLARQWDESSPINYFVLDDALPTSAAAGIHRAFPDSRAMTAKKSLREQKYVAAQLNRFNPLLEEAVYAFQAPEVIDAVEQITKLSALEPDPNLYAGGISLMKPGNFLNPHIDNSHDKLRQRYRVLNVLYYVSPEWTEHHGANLELWPAGMSGPPKTIVSNFNRLVVMFTHRNSWHSVSKNVSNNDRCCISNYFFSETPIGGTHYYHVTEFRGRPDQPFRDSALRADNWLRTLVRTRLPWAFKNPHFYDVKFGNDRSSKS